MAILESAGGWFIDALAWLGQLPRLPSSLLFVWSLVATMVGARYRHAFLATLLAGVAWGAGAEIAEFMYLPVFLTAFTLAVVVPFLIWPFVPHMFFALGVLTLGVMFAAMARVVPVSYAPGIAFVVAVGATSYVAWLYSVWWSVVVTSLWASVGLLSTLGTVIAVKPESCLAHGGAGRCSGLYLALGVVLCGLSIWLQSHTVMDGGDHSDDGET